MSHAPALRRGWCPGMLRPMTTGDGLLVRLHPPFGILSAVQMRAIAAVARECGSGLLDVSSRGNAQIRGVSEATHPALVERLIAAGLTDNARSEGPYRLTVTSPLAGLDPSDMIDAHALAERIEAESGDLTGLPAKISVVVDGGGDLTLDGIAADLRLVALRTAKGAGLALGLMGEGGPDWIGVTSVAAAPRIVRTVLSVFVDLLRARLSDARRVRDLSPALKARLVQAIELDAIVIPPPRGPTRVGLVTLDSDHVAVLIGLPYGRCDAAALERIAGWAERFGRGEVRLSPWRGISLPGIKTADAPCVLAEVTEAGFIVDPTDLRLSITACPGAAGCAAGSTDTHRDADRIAATARHLLAAGATVHVSGCTKGCACSGQADLTLVGAAGHYRVVLGGTADEQPLLTLPFDAVAARLAMAKTRTDLMQALSKDPR